uniref:Uncharacterized protein n=1 Tax=Solibacter usitatus (strain Ellin6076) TaxID=234267 RepID=Q01RH4_SOLUE
MEYAKRLEIGNRLVNELNKAHDLYVHAKVELEGLLETLPSGIPCPDGDLRLRQAGAAIRFVFEQYVVALRRYTDFAVHGRVPEDHTER